MAFATGQLPHSEAFAVLPSHSVSHFLAESFANDDESMPTSARPDTKEMGNDFIRVFK